MVHVVGDEGATAHPIGDADHDRDRMDARGSIDTAHLLPTAAAPHHPTKDDRDLKMDHAGCKIKWRFSLTHEKKTYPLFGMDVRQEISY